MTGSDFSEITKATPEKSLTVSLKKNAGRNNQGKITVRHQGGGSRRKYRIIDFKRRKDGIPAVVKSVEYDPNRTANIALICYADGEKAYILAPEGLKVGQKVMNGPEAEIRVGNCLPLELIPVGTMVHNIELHPGKGGQMVRSAGNGAQLMAKEGKYATLRLPSGEMRMVPIICRATVGIIGNGDHNLINIGKAGRKRHMGIRPTVRGSVMNRMTIHMVVERAALRWTSRSVYTLGQTCSWSEDKKEKQSVQQAHRKKTRWKSFKQIIRRIKECLVH